MSKERGKQIISPINLEMYIKVGDIIKKGNFYNFLVDKDIKLDLPNYDEFIDKVILLIKDSIDNNEKINNIRIVFPEMDKKYGVKSKFLGFSSYANISYGTKIRINPYAKYANTISIFGRKHLSQYLLNANISVEVISMFDEYLKVHKNNNINVLYKKIFSTEILSTLGTFQKQEIKPIIIDLVNRFILYYKRKGVNNEIIEYLNKISNNIVRALINGVMNGLVMDFANNKKIYEHIKDEFRNVFIKHSQEIAKQDNTPSFYDRYLIVIKTDKKIKYVGYIKGHIHSTSYDIPEYMQMIYEDNILRYIFNTIYINKYTIGGIKTNGINKLALFGYYPLSMLGEILGKNRNNDPQAITYITARINYLMGKIANTYGNYPFIYINIADKYKIANIGNTNIVNIFEKYKWYIPEEHCYGLKVNNKIEVKYKINSNPILNIMLFNNIWQFLLLRNMLDTKTIDTKPNTKRYVIASKY